MTDASLATEPEDADTAEPETADDTAQASFPVDKSDPTVTADTSTDDVSSPPPSSALTDSTDAEPSTSAPGSTGQPATGTDETALVQRVVEEGKAAVEALIARTTAPSGAVTIDGNVTQGNRVIPSNLVLASDPFKVLTDRVKDHFAGLQGTISNLEADLNQLKDLANRIGVGL